MRTKTVRMLVSLVCVLALMASMSSMAFASGEPRASGEPAVSAPAGAASGEPAAAEPTLEEVYSMAQRALDQQAIQNVMSRHVMYHCYGEHREEMEQIWVQEYENQMTASFGQNQGFYVGYGSIWDAYVTGHDSSWLTSAKRYCENNGIDITGWTDEQILDTYGGVGQLLLHVTTTAIIEVAEDGKTAKAFWYSPGMIAETGQSGNTIWEAYGVDFVKEGDEWKIWHLHMFTDFMGSFYLTLGGGNGASGGPGGGGPGGASGEASSSNAQGDMTTVDEFLRHEYLSSPQYSEFSSNRLRSQMEVIPIPVPYETWSFDEPNFGPTAAEYASLGIDLASWYAAQG